MNCELKFLSELWTNRLDANLILCYKTNLGYSDNTQWKNKREMREKKMKLKIDFFI